MDNARNSEMRQSATDPIFKQVIATLLFRKVILD